jgi:putative FmdB family regulatory protein
MPLYEYECMECGIRFDRLQRFGDPQPEICPNGHSQVHRLLSQPAIIFRGSGFYVTDNGRNGHGRPSRNGGGKKTSKHANGGESASSAKTEQ